MGAELDRDVHAPRIVTGDAAAAHPAGTADVYVFVPFLARPGCERDLERAILSVLAPTRAEPGCVTIHAFGSLLNGGVFYIHSIWRDEAAFAHHSTMPHTVAFLDAVSRLIEHPVCAIRTRRLDDTTGPLASLAAGAGGTGPPASRGRRRVLV